MLILNISLYLIDTFCCDAAVSSRSSKFTPMYGADKRSVAPSVAAISVEASVTKCAVKCLDLGQSCAGYNWRPTDDGRVDCDLKARYSVDLDVVNRDNWVYYASSYVLDLKRDFGPSPIPGSWYLYVNSAMTHTEAVEYCAGLHPQVYLAEVQSPDENQHLLTLASWKPWTDTIDDLHLGAERPTGGSVNEFLWLTTGGDTRSSYNNWWTAINQPNGLHQSCIALGVYGQGQWRDDLCSSLRKCVCEYNG